MKKYEITLSDKLDFILNNLSDELNISRIEVFKRALVLFKEAVKGDEVIISINGQQRKVEVK